MTWNDLLEQELKEPYFVELIQFLKKEDQTKTILPIKENRLNAFKLTPFDQVKVIIIGQDPYHNYNQAHGLSFSVESGAYPPSLKNIYQELVDDLKVSYPKTGNLTKWAKQGVLLLNTVLTVEVHQPLSHQGKGWEIYTRKMVNHLCQQNRPLVFILWGSHAQKIIPDIQNSKHLIIKSVHPSPLSAHRGFFGSKPFSKANGYLIANQLEPIDWQL